MHEIMQTHDFKFIISSCKKYKNGILATGTIQRGTVTSLDIVYLNTPIAVESSIYPIEAYVHCLFHSGRMVEKCHKGQQISIYLKGINVEHVIPNQTYLSSQKLPLSKESIAIAQGIDNTTIKKQDIVNKLLKSTGEANEDKQEPALNSAEKTYVKNIRVCINTNGYISPTEIYVLDKIRQVLNISPERAQELFRQTLSTYKANQSENIYRDAVSMCLLDCNYITKSERRLLTTLQTILGISDMRAYEIEDESKW